MRTSLFLDAAAETVDTLARLVGWQRFSFFEAKRE